MLLTAQSTARSLATLELDFVAQATRETAMAQAGLEAVRVSSPAARSLPLLAALAGAGTREIVLPYMETSHLSVKVTPC